MQIYIWPLPSSGGGDYVFLFCVFFCCGNYHLLLWGFAYFSVWYISSFGLGVYYFCIIIIVFLVGMGAPPSIIVDICSLMVCCGYLS